MPPPSPATIDQSRAFAANELFFSTTDARGVITSGNEVFVRISGYSEAELVDHAHNLIRHPDMPQAAFRLVWSRLKARQPVAALVKNRAQDGRYYWVVALITPDTAGYLSVRFKPAGKFLPLAETLYARMLAAEHEARDRGADLAAIMDAGAAVLQTALTAHGFASYEAFMWVMLCEELKSRDAAVARAGGTIVRPLPSDQARREVGRAALRHLAEIYRDGCTAYEQLNRLYRRIDEFVALNETLGRKSAFVNRLTDELRISSINVALASTRLGNEGLSLSVISRHMGDTSGQVAGSVHGMVAGIDALSGRLRGVIFDIAAARLQVEMVLTFVYELLSQSNMADAWLDRRRQIETLHRAFSTTIGHASAALHELESTVHPLSLLAENLENYMMSLQVAQMGAIVESARISNQGDFLDIFVSIREQIEQTHRELLELSEALHRLDRLSNEAPPIARDVCNAVTRMEGDIAGFQHGALDSPTATTPPRTPSAAPRVHPAIRPPAVAPTASLRRPPALAIGR